MHCSNILCTSLSAEVNFELLNMDSVTNKTATYNRLFYPLIAFGLFLALNVVPKTGYPWKSWAWFNYHPLFMSLAFVPLSSLVRGCLRVAVYVCSFYVL